MIDPFGALLRDQIQAMQDREHATLRAMLRQLNGLSTLGRDMSEIVQEELAKIQHERALKEARERGAAQRREWAETEGLAESLRAPLESAAPDWKARVRTEAAAMCLRQRAGNASPTGRSLSDDLAAWCQRENVTTKHGIFPSPGYIRMHVLRGWRLPE